MSYLKQEFLRVSLVTLLYRLSLSAGLLGYILCLHRATVDKL